MNQSAMTPPGPRYAVHSPRDESYTEVLDLTRPTYGKKGTPAVRAESRAMAEELCRALNLADAFTPRRSPFRDEVEAELAKATAAFTPMHSAHEAYAVLSEEMDELWFEVRKNQRARDYGAMHRELVQIAAMAERFDRDVIDSPMRGHEARSVAEQDAKAKQALADRAMREGTGVPS